jgi:alpha-beta hydrolase superfamily lysophospholipase
MKPTIVLVHGAFAESASWNYVIDSLAGTGHPVIAVAKPATTCSRSSTQRLTFLNSLASRPERTTHEH